MMGESSRDLAVDVNPEHKDEIAFKDCPKVKTIHWTFKCDRSMEEKSTNAKNCERMAILHPGNTA